LNQWFISDTHFGHANIIKYSNRPFLNVDDMNDKMIKEWNKLVKPGDLVYHMGDFAFMPYHTFKGFLWNLNGNIHLMLGNHDKMITEHKDELLKQGKFASIQHYRELKASGKTLILFHYGQRVWNKSHHDSIHLYGHSHGSLPPFGKSVDVGVDCKEIVCAAGPQGKKDASEYRPIHLDEVLDYMDKRKPEVVDHHGEEA
jgi:calcineurin-like phosphoesterase family protein